MGKRNLSTCIDEPIRVSHRLTNTRYHLESLIYGAIAIPIGLVVYGWTAENAVPSVIPIMATGFVGFGVMFTFVSVVATEINRA